jgi:site-specific recombinase XerD
MAVTTKVINKKAMDEGNAKLVVRMRDQGFDDSDIAEVLGFKRGEVKQLADMAADFDDIKVIMPVSITPVMNLSTNRVAISEEVQAFLGNSISKNTKRSYAAQWAMFIAWAERVNQQSLPASGNTVAAYLAYRALNGAKANCLGSMKAAIRMYHAGAGFDDPTGGAIVRQTLKGIRREYGTESAYKKPIMAADLKKMLLTLDRDTLAGKRDAALLLLSYATASRVSEMQALEVQDVHERSEGLLVHIRRSKTDKEGAGYDKPVVYGKLIATCPVQAVKVYLEAAGVTEGRVFRSLDNGHMGEHISLNAIRDMIKRMATDAGLDAQKIACHSLRSGAISQGAKNGIPLTDLAKLAAHSTVLTTQRYVHRVNIWDNAASGNIGL